MKIPQLRIIGARDIAWQEAFHRYIERIFPRVSFREWCSLGGWTEGYRAFALTEGSEIVANASLQRMTLVLEGRELDGWQLGAVGVVPERRGRGLQREILGHVLQEVGRDFALLFANDSVVDFYPRFGFTPVEERFFRASLEMTPSARRLIRLDFARPEHLELLNRIADTAEPVTLRFGARRYANVLLWYWSNFYRQCFYYSSDPEAIVVATQAGERLQLADVLSAGSIELSAILPRIIQTSIQQVEFGFTPERMWPTASTAGVHEESPLFVIASASLPAQPFKYPVLAQT